jgi:hypothetical protein
LEASLQYAKLPGVDAIRANIAKKVTLDARLTHRKKRMAANPKSPAAAGPLCEAALVVTCAGVYVLLGLLRFVREPVDQTLVYDPLGMGSVPLPCFGGLFPYGLSDSQGVSEA